jgi:hypothetical protein
VRGDYGVMSDKAPTFWTKGRKWAVAIGVPLLIWAAVDFRSGFFEGLEWGPKQLGSKIGEALKRKPPETRPTESAAPGAPLETGTLQIPTKPSAKEKPAREGRAACERRRSAELLEAEVELAVMGERVRVCLEEAKNSLPGWLNPSKWCREVLEVKSGMEVRRDAIVAWSC